MRVKSPFALQPDVQRQMPCWKADAYTMDGSAGSSATWLTPRALALPFHTRFHVAPPSVVFHRPKGGKPGLIDTEPPVTEEMPRTPRVVPTYMTCGLLGSMAIDEIE